VDDKNTITLMLALFDENVFSLSLCAARRFIYIIYDKWRSYSILSSRDVIPVATLSVLLSRTKISQHSGFLFGTEE
jgi:hypothetical protein